MNFKSLDNAPNELLELWNNRETNYEKFLPSNIDKISYSELDNGYILKTGGSHTNLYLLLGNIQNFERLNELEGGTTIVLDGKFSDDKIPEQWVDFKVDWTDRELQKYKSKNSTERRIREEKITFEHYKSSSMFLNVPLSDFINLFHKWAKVSKTEATPNMGNMLKALNNPDLEKICYWQNDEFAGFQVFERQGNQIYWQVNIIDYDKLGKSCIAMVHPLEWFKQPIHYLGARVGDRRLYDHKMRICKGKFWTFKIVNWNSKTKNKPELIEKVKIIHNTKYE